MPPHEGHDLDLFGDRDVAVLEHLRVEVPQRGVLERSDGGQGRPGDVVLAGEGLEPALDLVALVEDDRERAQSVRLVQLLDLHRVPLSR